MFIIPEINNEREIRVFVFDDLIGRFKELEIIDRTLPLKELLDQELILLFIDPKRKRVWMWIGRLSTTKMKFTAAQDSYRIRDQFAFGYKITSVDEGNEPRDFKIFIGMEEEEEEVAEGQTEPQYKGLPEEEEVFESMTKEQILRILEKAGVPDGFERRMVIVNKEIYLYKVSSTSLGSDIKEKKLISRKEEIDDGWYLMEDYTPRVLFSYNKILIIDLLQKIKDIKS